MYKGCIWPIDHGQNGKRRYQCVYVCGKYAILRASAYAHKSQDGPGLAGVAAEIMNIAVRVTASES
jgi:hypothetical protein